MTEQLPSCIEQMRDYDHKGFIQALQLNESSVDKLQAVMKVTNYYRQVIPVHVLASQTIRARLILVAEKYQYFKKDMNRMKNLMNVVTGKSKFLSYKIAKIEAKQHELTSRAKCLESYIKNEKISLTSAEIQCKYDLENFKKKSNSLKNVMDCITSKLERITAHNELYSNVKKLYFQEWQLEVVKISLFCMNDGIRNLMEETNSFKSLLGVDEPE